MSTVYVVQHAEPETPGTIGLALRARRLTAKVVRAYAGAEIPREMGRARGLVVMGGPMGVHEAARFPFLQDEMRLIERALRAEVPVLGVCLGSQLLASVLGAHVSRARAKEIGWLPVELAASAGRDPIFRGVKSPIVPCHWHGDVFTLPAGAVALARSQRTRCQAFRYGRTAYGMLFHMEFTRPILRKMTRTFRDELAAERIEPGAILDGADLHLPRLEPVARAVFERWADQCTE
jgi:GMP synthase-like glutamine amidotransferase